MFMLKVAKKAFQLEPVPMRYTRPILYEQVELSKIGLVTGDEEEIEEALYDIIKNRVKKSKDFIKYAFSM